MSPRTILRSLSPIPSPILSRSLNLSLSRSRNLIPRLDLLPPLAKFLARRMMMIGERKLRENSTSSAKR